MKKIIVVLFLGITCYVHSQKEEVVKKDEIVKDLGDMTSDEYFNNQGDEKKPFFEKVLHVESEVGAFTVTGQNPDKTRKAEFKTKYKETNEIYKVRVIWKYLDGNIKSGNIFKVTTSSSFVKGKHNWGKSFSILTVPFKVRPKTDEFKGRATAGIKNVGVNIDLGYVERERYFFNGKKSTLRWSYGFHLAPAVETIKAKETDNSILMDEEESNQLFISSGITVSFNYNGLTFTAIPLGLDFATGKIGQSWAFDKKYWFGFGIGLEPKFLQASTNDK